MKNESVLYVSRGDLSARFDLQKQTFLATMDQLNALPFSYALRTELECDPTRKQLIPYALLFDADGRILSYSRNGSEERLRRKRSVGFGGHVNDKDEGNSLFEILCSGLLRELNEEVGLQISAKSLNLLGVINEEVSTVGLSHTGVVFKVELSAKDFSFDREIQNPHWGECGGVKEEGFELWSVLALKLAKQFEEK